VVENLYPLQKGRDGSGCGCHCIPLSLVSNTHLRRHFFGTTPRRYNSPPGCRGQPENRRASRRWKYRDLKQFVGRRRSPFYLLRLRFRRGIAASPVVISRSGVSLKRVASNAAFYMIVISAAPVTFC
jgi:hypothetical protein